jgi:tetratricopeptide (TPR) repeat protein
MRPAWSHGGTTILLAAVFAVAGLLLANCSKQVTTEPATDQPVTAMPRSVTHRVSDGETLAMVADNYYGDPARADSIARANGLEDPDRLAPGSVLQLTFGAEEWPHAQRRLAALQPYNRGVAMLAQDDLEGAEQQFRLAVEIAPELANARFNLAVVFIERGRYLEAQELLVALVGERPGDPDFRYAYGHTLFLQADFAAAATVFRELLARYPEHRRGTFGLARSYQESGQRDEAIRTWQRYLALDNSSSWAAAARRNLQLLQGG